MFMGGPKSPPLHCWVLQGQAEEPRYTPQQGCDPQGQARTAPPARPVPQLSPPVPPRWHSQGGSLSSCILPMSFPVAQGAKEGVKERSRGALRPLGGPSWMWGYRMVQGGRLLVIFSSGSPFLALRIASIS